MNPLQHAALMCGALVACLLVPPLVASPHHCDHHYGPCKEQPFLPAPPGKTPGCAKPGNTFCEKIEHYPVQLVRYLVERWGYDYDSLLKDESRDHFSYRAPLPYGPHHHPHPGYPYPASKMPLAYYPALVNTVPQPGRNLTAGPYPDRRYKLPAQDFNNIPTPYLYSEVLQPAAITHYNPDQWWNSRYTRTNHNTEVSPAVNIAPPPPPGRRRRRKRQAGGGGGGGGQSNVLCPTSTRFIMPRAAMNNRGNWMYVVNLNEVNDRYTQLVGTETCASSQCNGLCSIPNGYTSRCEQQYVQKRLVAVEGAGDNLYTDVFWFPHCCVCQITQSNG